VALLDVAKGIVAAVAGGAIGPEPWAGALAGVAAVVGHVRSVFIGFGGGRGVATGAGAMLVLAPLAVLASLPEFGIVVWATRLVSLGSMLAAVTVALVAAALYAVGWAGIEAVVAAALIGLVVVLAHADNIQRLLAGTERRIGDG
jgi:glycerol-3-phosphate acyltransferase PlsY